MKRFLLIAAVCAAPVTAHAAVAPSAASSATVRQADHQVRVADYYKGKKHCYTRGSATICN